MPTTIVTRAGKGSELTHAEVDANFTNLQATADAALPTSGGTISANSASAALTINQIGAGNALVVEDSASPDATPFVIDGTGKVVIGATTARATIVNSLPLQIEGTGYNSSSISLTANTNGSANQAAVVIAKSRGTTTGAVDAVISGDTLGMLSFGGADGTAIIQAASISAGVDTAPSTNDMPGRLIFNTTPDGGSTSVEAARIDSAGQLIVGNTARNIPAQSTSTAAKFRMASATVTDTATAASGTVAHGALANFQTSAIAATNASVTYSLASTVYIAGAPTAGTNVTVTAAYSLYVAAGNEIHGGNTRFGGTTAPTVAVDVTGAVLATSNIRSSGVTAGIGYATGAGLTVTQGTSRTTGVTINAVCGTITMFSAAGSTTAATFTVTNSAVAISDVIILNQRSGTNLYDLMVTEVAAGSFKITFRTTGGTSTDAPVINFAVIKAVTA